MDFTNCVKDFLKGRDASLVGVASTDRFRDAPVGHRPEDLLDGAESVIVIGVKLLESIADWPRLFMSSSVIPKEVRKEVASAHFYRRCGYEVINTRLEQLGLSIALYLEEKGHKAMYLPATYGHHANIMEMIPGYYAPFSHRHAAVRAGLGEFGLNNLVITPQFGPRVRFMSVITTAPLKPDTLLSEKVCLRSRCQLCIKSCPIGAIEPKQTESEDIFLNTPSITHKEICHEKRRDCWGGCINSCPIGQ